MHRLVVIYLTGKGVPQNFKNAYDLFTKSHNTGHGYYRLFLKIPNRSNQNKSFYVISKTGISLEEEDENELQYYSNEENSNKLVMEILEAMACNGNISVQYQMGCLYKNSNYSKANYWFDQALEGGITDAYYRLSVLFDEGLDIQKDCSQARVLYQKAAEKKHEKALYRLARLYHYGMDILVDYHKAFMLYKAVADEGSELAQNIFELLTVLHNSSTEKPSQELPALTIFEIKKTLSMYGFLAQNGDTCLQYQLGFFYENNSSGSDYTKAAKWYSLAKDSGHADSIYRLRKLCELSLGVPQDYGAAIKPYNATNKLGCINATYCLGNLYQNKFDFSINYEKAFQYYTKASKQGSMDTQYKLGQMYDNTKYTIQNTLKALEWYAKSYLQGNDNARYLPLLYDNDKSYETFFSKRLAKIVIKYVKIEDNYTNTKEYINPDICARLSYMYYTGKRIKKMIKKHDIT